jgi:hypothetical protein
MFVTAEVEAAPPGSLLTAMAERAREGLVSAHSPAVSDRVWLREVNHAKSGPDPHPAEQVQPRLSLDPPSILGVDR